MEAVNGSTMPVFYAVGNAHLDLAWLWPMAETHRKTERTFAAQLRLLEEYPKYKFIQSQPASYEMCRTYYPELFERIREAIRGGMPALAECGGFLYLQERLTDDRGRVFPMAGALPGLGAPAGGLRRFGYALLRAEADSLLFRAGEEVPAHEFHHWDSDACGDGLSARKPGTDRAWRCAVVRESLYAGFPHLHFGGERPLAERFAAAAANYGKERRAHV